MRKLKKKKRTTKATNTATVIGLTSVNVKLKRKSEQLIRLGSAQENAVS